MNDKNYQIQKQRIENSFLKWQKLTGLGWWNIALTFDRSYSPDNDRAVASTAMEDWRYRRGTITWFMPQVEDQSDRELDNIVIHELCHILLAPISCAMQELGSSYQRDLMEFNTELVAQALEWAYAGGKNESKNRSK